MSAFNQEKEQQIMFEKIDKNSELLMNEFQSHCNEVYDKVDKNADKRAIFEGWAIQKISSLQLTVIDLVEEIQDIQTQISDLKDK